jgi:hypothetical protein
MLYERKILLVSVNRKTDWLRTVSSWTALETIGIASIKLVKASILRPVTKSYKVL